MSHHVFKEQQKFRAWEAIAIIGALFIGLIYRLIEQQFLNPTTGGISLWVYFIFIAGLSALLLFLILPIITVKISRKAIKVKYLPWQKHPQKIKWKDVQVCEIVKTPLLAQLNGWNISFDHAHNYSTCGRNGLRLVTKNGEQFFIGSRKLGKLEKTLKQNINI